MLGDGEVYSGPLTSSKPLLLSRLPMLQSAHAVFTDFKANNFVCLQNIYRYITPTNHRVCVLQACVFPSATSVS